MAQDEIALPGDEGRSLKDTHLRRGRNLRDVEQGSAGRSQSERAAGALASEY